jgi:hypothetical protein
VTGWRVAGIRAWIPAPFGWLRRRRPGGERGNVAIEWVAGVGLLVLPIAMMVAVFPTWSERTSMARVAARESARVGALADTPGDGMAAGQAMAYQVAANHGVSVGDMSVTVLVPADAQGDPDRHGVVTATVTVKIPVTALPWFGTAGGFSWTVTHQEHIDRYRSFP